ncbi:MAG: hypothetical protein ACK5MJ_02965 [Alphaproteobacteria bacterium]
MGKEHLENLMAIESDRMTKVLFTKEKLDSEREVVMNERELRIGSVPYEMLGKQLLY